MSTIKDDMAELKEQLTAHAALSAANAEKLEEIQQELAKYRGFVGGVFWILGAMGIAVKMLWPLLKDALGMKG